MREMFVGDSTGFAPHEAKSVKYYIGYNRKKKIICMVICDISLGDDRYRVAQIDLSPRIEHTYSKLSDALICMQEDYGCVVYEFDDLNEFRYWLARELW